MKTMKFTITEIMILLVASYALIIYFGSLRQDKFKANIGCKFIIGKDTAMVLDYSTLKETYTFDNGKEVSVELIEKLKPVK